MNALYFLTFFQNFLAQKKKGSRCLSIDDLFKQTTIPKSHIDYISFLHLVILGFM